MFGPRLILALSLVKDSYTLYIVNEIKRLSKAIARASLQRPLLTIAIYKGQLGVSMFQSGRHSTAFDVRLATCTALGFREQPGLLYNTAS